MTNEALAEFPQPAGTLFRSNILEQNGDAYLVELTFDLKDWVRIYWVDKNNENVKLVGYFQDDWPGLVDISTGTVVQTE